MSQINALRIIILIYFDRKQNRGSLVASTNHNKNFKATKEPQQTQEQIPNATDLTRGCADPGVLVTFNNTTRPTDEAFRQKALYCETASFGQLPGIRELTTVSGQTPGVLEISSSGLNCSHLSWELTE